MDDAIKIVNEEMPPGYRLRKACQIRFQVVDDKPVNDTGERRAVFLKGTSFVKLSFDVDEEFCYRYRRTHRSSAMGKERSRSEDLPYSQHRTRIGKALAFLWFSCYRFDVLS